MTIEERLDAIERRLAALELADRKPAISSEPGGFDTRDEFSKSEVLSSIPIQNAYEARGQAGMSSDLAAVLTKIDRGIDLTPNGFEMPAWAGASYFYLDKHPPATLLYEGKAKTLEGFTESFVRRVKQGATERDAYVNTCEAFDVPAFEKVDDLRRKILAELPAQAGGGFRLGRAEVEAGQGLLNAGKVCQFCADDAHEFCEGCDCMNLGAHGSRR